jgi:hypothetical protein
MEQLYCEPGLVPIVGRQPNHKPVNVMRIGQK